MTILFGATGVFAQLQTALNTIWNVEPKPGQRRSGASSRTRILSFGMVLGIGFLLLVSLVVSAAPGGGRHLGDRAAAGAPRSLMKVLNSLVSFAVSRCSSR